MKSLLKTSVAALAMSCACNAANAQQATQAETSANPDASKGVSEIVVTAQRRSEPGQTVPVSIQTVDAGRLKTLAVQDTTDLPALVPGLTLARSGGGSESIFIRGIGAGGSVQKYVDGINEVYGNFPSVLTDIASVEVDKGPQSTLFGRNATGGVVQFTTKEPSSKPAADLTLGYANYNTFTANGYVTGGLAPGLKTSLSAYYVDQHDGWGVNFANGTKTYTNKQFTIRSKTVWDITDDFRATLTLNYNYLRTDVGNTISPAVSVPQIWDLVNSRYVTIPGRYNLNSDYTPYGTNRYGIVGLRLEKELGSVNLLSITSYQRNHAYLHLDYDGTPASFMGIDRTDIGTAWTQEFQLQSKDNSPVKWVAGLFYLSNFSDLKPYTFSGFGASAIFDVPTGEGLNIYATTGLQSYAAFGQATIPIFERTKLTLGARYTIDHLSISGYTSKGATVVPGSQGNSAATFRKPTFRVDLQHQFAAKIFGYASYNRGYNAGAFNNVLAGGFAGPLVPLNPETIDAYEVGLKTTLLDNHLRFNIAAYHYDYSNLQLAQYGTTTGASGASAAAARINGIDMDFEARPIPSLTISGGLQLLRSKFANYPGAPYNVFSGAPFNNLPAAGLLGATSNPFLPATNPPTIYNAAGNYTLSAPKSGANVTVQHVLRTDIGNFTSTAGLTYSGRWYADASNNFQSPPRHLINLSEQWTSSDTHTSILVFMKNVANVRYDAGINLLTPVGTLSEPGAPRTYGVTVSHHF